MNEISSNNSEKLNLLANKHLLTLILVKFPDVQSHGDHLTFVFTPEIVEKVEK